MSTGVSVVSVENIVYEATTELRRMSGLLSSANSESIKLQIRSSILEKVFEYCKHYEKSPPPSIPKPLPSSPFQELIPPWDFAFIELETELLLELTEASSILKLFPLLELCLAKLASIIRENSCEKIKSIFNLKD